MNDFSTIHLTERQRQQIAVYAWYELLIATNPLVAYWFTIQVHRFTFHNCRSAK